jgi:protein phosphatase PTC7
MNKSSFRVLGGLSIALSTNHALRPTATHLRSVHSDAAQNNAWKQISSGISIAEASKNGNGEDAYYILPRDVGVFDGVGGWRNSGIDSGLYSRHLAASVATFVKKQRGAKELDVDMAKALDYGAQSCKQEKLTGSTTVCFASLNEQKGTLKVLNLGDSGLRLFRKVGDKMKVVGETTETLHGFNFPAQIGNIGDPKLGKMDSDTSKNATYDSFEIQEGDIAIVGTDGLWDNLFEEQILEVLQSAEVNNREEDGVVVKEDIDKIAKAITLLALNQSISKTANTPWFIALEKEYLRQRQAFDKKANAGGKPDDITVIVSYFHKKK